MAKKPKSTRSKKLTRSRSHRLEKLVTSMSKEEQKVSLEYASAGLLTLFWRRHLDFQEGFNPEESGNGWEQILEQGKQYLGCMVRGIYQSSSAVRAKFTYEEVFEEIWQQANNSDFLKFVDRTFLNLSMTDRFEEFVEDEQISEEVSWQQFKTRIAPLTDQLIGSVRDIYAEYIAWLKHHPDALDSIAWDAFEKLIAEIFADRGFIVDLTGRVRNRSADIIAIRTDETGAELKYLIECKRFERTHRVGLDIVNAVLGAARRADADYALLVTSSSFTQNVQREANKLRSLHLHLHDGDAVREWLKDYTIKSEGGIWLAEGWAEAIESPKKTKS